MGSCLVTFRFCHGQCDGSVILQVLVMVQLLIRFSNEISVCYMSGAPTDKVLVWFSLALMPALVNGAY
jgi:hypothetical protein